MPNSRFTGNLFYRHYQPEYHSPYANGMVESGDLSYRVTHRKHDQLKALISDFNQMTDSLQDKVFRDYERVKSLTHQMRELAANPTTIGSGTAPASTLRSKVQR